MSITDPLPEVLRARPFAELQHAVVTAVQPPASGAVTGTCTVNLYGRPNIIKVVGGYVPAVGDVALVIVGDRRVYAIARMSTGATHPVIPAPPDAPATGTLTVPAVAAGTYQGGRLRTDRTDVLQGADGGGANQGAWVYGSTIAGTLAGLTVHNGRVWIDRRTGGPDPAEPLTLYLHAAQVMPTGPPVILDRYPLPDPVVVQAAVWVDLPAAWVTELATGAAYGLGIGDASASSQPPFMSLASLAASGQSGTVQIDWSR